MFGSLVIVLPTTYTGGSLHLRHNGEEYVHDSGKENLSSDQISWVTFFSDVEHEVKPVESGHRVTLTYNLHFCGEPLSSPPALPQEPILNALKAMLADQTALPSGGYLGFGLEHEYPISGNSSLPNLKKVLKGRDAALFNACQALGLNAQLKIIYDAYDERYMTDAFVDADYQIDDPAELFENGGICIEGEREDPNVSVDWISRPNDKTGLECKYVAYGNEASLGSVYGSVNLVVKIDGYEARSLNPA